MASSSPSSSPVLFSERATDRSRNRWWLGAAAVTASCVSGYCYYRWYHYAASPSTSASRNSQPPPRSGAAASSSSQTQPHSHSHSATHQPGAAHSLHPVVLFPQTAGPTAPVPSLVSSRQSPGAEAQAAAVAAHSLSLVTDTPAAAALSSHEPSRSSQSSPPIPLHCAAWRCSSPGKALLTGGYLVLEQRYCGLVLAVSARFHAVVVPCSDSSQLQRIATPSSPALYWAHLGRPPASLRPLQSDQSTASSASPANGAVLAVFLLHAPQRSDQLVEYWMSIAADGGAGGAASGVSAIRRYPADSEDNPFVLCSLYYTMHLLSAVLPPDTLRAKLASPVLLHVRGDHQFYSAQPLADSDPRWLDGKTGLGSSATLVSSLVGALCHYFQLADDGSSNIQLELHSALLQHLSSNSSTSGHLESGTSRPDSSLDSFTVVGHDLSTRPFSSSSSLPLRSVVSLPADSGRVLCHRLSQVAHCAAQGKVGSGFDVSAAYFGSQLYRRFSAACIEHVLPQSPLHEPLSIDRAALVQCVLPHVNHDCHRPSTVDSIGGELMSRAAAPSPLASPLSAPSSPSSAASPDSTSPSSSHSSFSSLSELERTPSPLTPPACALCSVLQPRVAWDERVSRLQLPSFLRVLLADVQGGAKTPGMVQQVMRWRQRNRHESSQLYDNMQHLMAAVELQFTTLALHEQSASHSRAELDATLAVLASSRADEWSHASTLAVDWLVAPLLQLRSSFSAIRRLYRAIGSASGVSIEPAAQTALCDATMCVEGVVAAGVPGAGGDDAIFVLAVRHPSDQHALTAALDSAWQQRTGSRAVRVLPLEQAIEGVHFSHDRELHLDTLKLPVRQAAAALHSKSALVNTFV